MVQAVFWYMMPSVVLTIIGTTFVITSFLMFKKFRQKSPHHSVICCIAICDWVFTLSWWLPFVIPLSWSFCLVQAFMLEVFAVAGWIWPAIFALRLLVSNMFEIEPSLSWAIVSHVTGWGIPLFLAIYCGAVGMYGHAGLWCWIDDQHPTAQIFLGDGLVVITFMIELTAFSLLMRSMRRTGSGFGQLKSERRNVTLRMSLFLLIPPLCWSWALVDRLLGYVSGTELYWLQVVHAVMATSQGFFNALLYGWDPELMYLWAGPCFKKYLSQPEQRRLIPEALATDTLNSIDVNNLYIESERFGGIN